MSALYKKKSSAQKPDLQQIGCHLISPESPSHLTRVWVWAVLTNSSGILWGLTRARSRLLLCSWKAAGLFSAVGADTETSGEIGRTRRRIVTRDLKQHILKAELDIRGKSHSYY